MLLAGLAFLVRAAVLLFLPACDTAGDEPSWIALGTQENSVEPKTALHSSNSPAAKDALRMFPSSVLGSRREAAGWRMIHPCVSDLQAR